jgi:hypothetical protein
MRASNHVASKKEGIRESKGKTSLQIVSMSLNFSRKLILLDGLKGNSESTR